MQLADGSLLLNIILVLLWMCCIQRRLRGLLKHLWQVCRPYHWKAQSPRECPQCQAGLKLQVLRSNGEIRPYKECKSRRGCKQIVRTDSFACPQPGCAYHGVTDASPHALVGYGTHNSIQCFKGQACTKVFTRRVNTPLYYLKTNPKQIEMGLWFLAEGVDASVLVRFTGHADATLARWLERMGRHSQNWHNLYLG